MSEAQSNGRPDAASRSPSAMLSWLGFFLLVFVVAGLAFYLTGNAKQVADNPQSSAVTQKSQ
jgi:hypothetical protein